MSGLLDILPIEVMVRTMTFLTELDLVIMMYVCKQTKKASVKILETDRVSLQYVVLTDLAAQAGYLSVVQWLCSLKYKFRPSACVAAARGGHSTILEWLRVKGCKEDYRTHEMAAKYGHFELLHQAHFKNQVNPRICAYAAIHGKIDVIEWLHSNGYTWDYGTVYQAAKYGHMELLQWLNSHCDYPSIYFTTAPIGAAKGGHSEILLWLLTKSVYSQVAHCNSEYTNICEQAAKHNRLEILKIIKEKWGQPGFQWSQRTFQNFIVHTEAQQWAACKGHLDVLAWFKEIKCDIPSVVDRWVVRGGQLHILEWLKTIGYRSSSLILIIEIACRYGHVEILELYKDRWNEFLETYRKEKETKFPFDTFERAMIVTKWIKLQNAHLRYLRYAYNDMIINVVETSMRTHKEYFKKYTIDETI